MVIKKDVIVVGGGGAGANIARLLSDQLDPSLHTLTLINARPFTVFLPATVRMAVTDEGNLEEQILIPFDRLLSKRLGEVRVGKVVAIEEDRPGAGGHVVLAGGDKLHYDVLVLTPGTALDGPLAYPDTKEETLAFIKEWRRKFRDANHIVMAGGGPVNIELAGEIKEYWPEKKVTIVQSRKLPLHPSYPDRFRSRVEKECKARGIEFVFEDYLDQEVPKDGAVTTRSGKRLVVDMVVVSRGGTPSTGFIKNFDSSIVTERGFVRTHPSLEVITHPGIFCAGDVVDNEERNGLGKYERHAAVVIANVLDHLNGRALSRTYKARSSVDTITLTLGKSGGVAFSRRFGGTIWGNWVVWFRISRTLYVPQARRRMGY
ncbi:FAD/NAD(P)-binding domain-containing protein [Artomyces pyxidatus]|uniref:FAD/NAD(P)-binding domain-containing protein n=1 Tax=Artomyces pyxidatus TaxID=48021 RepID=A0ACB8TA84_9AGAM|nr:FAD/NAD(P)-binding domain-containing protein [Artomyces pyxidatus]